MGVFERRHIPHHNLKFALSLLELVARHLGSPLQDPGEDVRLVVRGHLVRNEEGDEQTVLDDDFFKTQCRAEVADLDHFEEVADLGGEFAETV